MLLQSGDLQLKGADVWGCAETGLVPCLLAEAVWPIAFPANPAIRMPALREARHTASAGPGVARR